MPDPTTDTRLGRRLVLDELFDLSLYRALHRIAPAPQRAILEQLIPIETRHHAFWQEFFKLDLPRLDWGRRLKLWLMVGVARLFGASAIHLILEAIEVFGVRKYLTVWRRYEHGPLGAAVREVLEDEFKQELWGFRQFVKFRSGAEQRPWTTVAKHRLPERLAEQRKKIRGEVDRRKRERRFAWW